MTFSIFARISPDGGENIVKPAVTRESAFVTIQLPYSDDGKGYWLIMSNRRLGVDELEFRDLVQMALLPESNWRARFARRKITSIESLQPFTYETPSGREERSIVVRLTVERAACAYIYHDFAIPVLDGGYYYTIDVPSYLIESTKGTTIKDADVAARFGRRLRALIDGFRAKRPTKGS